MYATQHAPLGLGKGQPQEADAPDNADAYERLDEVLMAAMEREVDKRTATAVEFGRQLQEVQAALGHQPTDLEVPE